jgi:uncharacterized protein with von Willebrand factor type A (vWA) domain
MQSYFRGLQQSIQQLTPQALQQIREMVHDLNRLLRDHQRGEADFQEFWQQWGHFFPQDIKSVDQLAEHLRQQAARMESLLRSMSPEMRRELEQMLESVFQDGQLQAELGQLSANLRGLFPTWGGEDAFSFSGDEPLTLQEAMRLMGDLGDLEQLERQLGQALRTNDAAGLDAERLGKLIDAEARSMLEQLQQLTRTLEEAGLIERRGSDWALTPRAMRRIGQHALQDIFGSLKSSVFGNHSLERRGVGPERLDETRPYSFGDPFLIDAQKSVLKAVLRDGQGLPVRLRPEDFEIYTSQELTQCSTVIMLDMSYSMMMAGRFKAGQKVALALDSLIRTQFPRDNLYILAFSYFVLRLQPEMLLDSYWVEFGGGTNFEEAFRQARRILARHKQGTRQVIIITDGEPTSYNYGSRWDDDFDGYRASYGTIASTLREVVRCTREQITINTFMMARDPGLTQFVRLMAKINRGRAFFTSPSNLGEYVLVDFLANKRRVERRARSEA